MTTRFRSHALAGAALCLILAAACGYSPNPADGTLKCGSSNTCPDGYSCRSGSCWKKSGGGGSGGGGTGGGSSADNFIGTWSFAAPSRRMIGCTDGYTENVDWTGLGEMFEITAGGSAALATYYYCDWDLDIVGTATVIKPAAACSATDDTVTPPVTYTWHGMAFTLSTGNGTSGTLAADIPYDYVSTSGSGSCTMHFTGTMTKN